MHIELFHLYYYPLRTYFFFVFFVVISGWGTVILRFELSDSTDITTSLIICFIIAQNTTGFKDIFQIITTGRAGGMHRPPCVKGGFPR